MKISAIKINNNFISYKFKNSATNSVNYKTFSFGSLPCAKKTDIDIQKLQEQDSFEEFMDRKGKVTKEEFKDIVKNHPSTLLKAQKFAKMLYVGETTPEEMAKIAISTSEFLNKEFKNYRIISLGTSPAPLTEQLQNLGHEVVFLPASALSWCCDSLEMNTLMEYLKSKNINDGKLNIILDYTSSGQTLSEMTGNIKKKFHLNSKKIKQLSLNDVFHYLHKTSHIKTWNYYKDLFDSAAENISNVPHFPVSSSGVSKYRNSNKAGTIYMNGLTKEEVFREFENYSTPLARCFSLCTMAEIDKLTR